MDHKDIQDLKQQFNVLIEAYNTEKDHLQQLESMMASTVERVQLLEQKVLLRLFEF